MTRTTKKMLASVGLWRQRYMPAGMRKTRMWRSKKKDVQAAGWCSETEAIKGSTRAAYVGSRRAQKRPVQRGR